MLLYCALLFSVGWPPHPVAHAPGAVRLLLRATPLSRVAPVDRSRCLYACVRWLLLCCCFASACAVLRYSSQKSAQALRAICMPVCRHSIACSVGLFLEFVVAQCATILRRVPVKMQRHWSRPCPLSRGCGPSSCRVRTCRMRVRPRTSPTHDFQATSARGPGPASCRRTL